MEVLDVRKGINEKIDALRCHRCKIPLTDKDTVFWCSVRGCSKTKKRGPSVWEYEYYRMEPRERLARTNVGEVEK